MTDWVFYNAHFVDTVFGNLPLLGSTSNSFVGVSEDGFTVLLYLVVPVLLLAAGLALARFHWVRSPVAGISLDCRWFRGTSYCPSSACFFSRWQSAVSGTPDLLVAVVLAGVALPVIFGGIGCFIGGFLEQPSRA